jgi:ComF family protein
LRRVERLSLPLCGICAQPVDPAGPPHGCRRASAALTTIFAVGAYMGPLREAVHALKYHGRHGVAATLAALLAPAVAPFLQEGDLLVPVPLHPTRERARGYNQSAILASELQYLLPVEVATAALRRTRATADQTALSADQRAANVRGAFTARADAVSGRRIWLLDDVYTTGATLRASAQALRAAGAREVRGAVVAIASG